MPPKTIDQTVELDVLIDAAVAYGGSTIDVPLWPFPQYLDWTSGVHGDTGRIWDVPPDALRPWRRVAFIETDRTLGDEDAATIVTSRSMSELRGRAWPAPNTVEVKYVTPKGRKYGRIPSFYVAHIGGLWKETSEVSRRGAKPLRIPTYSRSIDIAMDVYMAMLLEAEYRWQAVFHEVKPGAASFMIPTDAAGALSLFRLRDKPDGTTRRPALRHWVSAHSRQLGSGRATSVIEHLRGRTEFTWSGMNVSLMPSPVDLDRAEKARATTRRTA